MAAHHEETHGFRVVFLEHITDGEEVAQRLGHLFVVHIDEAVVHPHLRKRLAGRAFALCDFVFVVGKLQVSATAVDVKALAQHLTAHGRALDVPAGAAFAKGAGPFHISRLFGLGGFPQHKVQRVMLTILHSHTLTGIELVQRLARELAVAGKLAYSKVHIAIACLVSQAFVLQRTNHLEHLRHVFGGTRLKGGALNTQGVGVLVQGIDHAIGQAANGFAVFHGALDDLVVNVRDVAHIGDAIAACAQPALHHVKGDHGTSMAQVAQVINRHAADIHADMSGFKRRKRFQCTRQRVVDTQTHGVTETEVG